MAGTGLATAIAAALSLAVAAQARAEQGGQEDEEVEAISPSLGSPPDVPATLPDGYIALAFENRSGVHTLDWLSAAVPFMLAEKLELHPAVRPVYGALVVPRGRPDVATAATVVKASRPFGATWVFTGWFDRPHWHLELAVSLWKVEGDVAVLIGEVVSQDDFSEIHKVTGKAIEVLCTRAGMPLSGKAAAEAQREPTRDFYAFHLFGRALGHLLGTAGVVDGEAALKGLLRSVTIDPKLAEAQRLLGEHFLQLRQYSQARTHLLRALGVRPDYYAAAATEAKLQFATRKLRQARELNEALLHRRPWDLERRYELGRALWEAGDVDGSLEALAQVVHHDPGHIDARRILVLVYATRGARAELVRELEALVRLEPRDLATRLDLGAAYAAIGQTRDAIATYERVIAEKPHHVQALKFLGDLYRNTGELDKAIAVYRRALEAKPGDPRPYFLLGAAFLELGDERAAKLIYQRARRFPKYLGEVYNNLGAIAYREGKLDEAIWYLDRAVGRSPANVRFRYNYALALSATRRVEEARKQIQVALQYDDHYADLHYLNGVVLLRLGHADDAHAAFQRAVQLDPLHEDARHNLVLLDQLRRRAEEGELAVEQPQ